MSVVEVKRQDGVCWLRLNRPEVRNAWTAEMGDATGLLVERVGPLRATEIAMLAEDIPADRALGYGLVNAVVDQVEARALALAQRLAAGPTRAYGAIKEALQAWSADALSRQMAREGHLLQGMVATRDFVEGKRAFDKRRMPGFTSS